MGNNHEDISAPHKPVRVAVWNEGESFFWDDAEDHGGFDRISPNGPFADRESAKADAVTAYGSVKVEAGPPDHYADAERAFVNGRGPGPAARAHRASTGRDF